MKVKVAVIGWMRRVDQISKKLTIFKKKDVLSLKYDFE